jgi:hypothetical protein
MNSLHVWCGVPDGQPAVAWESSTELLRLTEMLQQLNEVFDVLAEAADATVTPDAA